MSVLVDMKDITSHVHGIREARGFRQTAHINPLALKPGSAVSADLAPGAQFTIYGRLLSDTPANLRTLIGNMGLWLRPRKENYRIDFNGSIFYAKALSLTIEEPNLFATHVMWEAQFASERAIPLDTNTTKTLAQDTIVEFMNDGPGITLPMLYKTITGSVTFELADIKGSVVENIANTTYTTTNWGDPTGYGSVANEYEYKLLDNIACLKWASGTSQSGNEGGLKWHLPSSIDLSAENCYTVWFALLGDTGQLTTVRVGLGDGTNIGYSSVTARLSDSIWSWIPVFVRECKKNNAALNLVAITRVYVLFTPNTNDSIDVYVGGNITARNPAKTTLAVSAYGYYNLRDGKFHDRATGESKTPSVTITGKPWIRPGCNLIYQNSSATAQYAYVRGGK